MRGLVCVDLQGVCGSAGPTVFSSAVAIISTNENNLLQQATNAGNPGVRRVVVGVVGGVGAGKSSVFRAISGFRLSVVDADRIGHQQLQQAAVRQALVQRFGSSILGENGEIDRRILGSLVFGSTPESQQNLAALNELVRPGIRAEIHRQIQQAPQDVDAVLLDAALLLEAGWAAECDGLIFIDTPLVLRQQRVFLQRGWTADELARREASQWDLAKKRQACGFVVDNSGTLENSAAQFQQHLATILRTSPRSDSTSSDRTADRTAIPASLPPQ